ncbi:MAG: Gfo/Idh/MocA family oxidoreductase [Actinobacteria bacterium]|nr:Gfo/Idh/MocA family oxidoreductase [Actinomycetota bacterium]
MRDPVRIGVIGTGWWATQFHVPGLISYEDAEVVALADPDADRLRAAGDAFGVERLYEDHRGLLDAADVDGVVVAVPHAFHYDIAAAALDAGKHVMLEKPMTLVAEEAWDLVDRAERYHRHLVIGYTHQFTRSARRAREIVRSGRLGELRLISGLFASMVESYLRGSPEDYADVFGFPVTGPDASTYSDPTVSGGGQGQTQVTHTMAMMFWVTGLRPVEVFARMANHDLAVDLVDAITYRCEGGALGTMASIGSLRPGQTAQQQLRYFGSEGFMVQDLISGRLDAQFNDGTEEILPPLAEDEAYPAHATARCLVDLIRGEGVNDGPPEPAAVTVEFLEAAYRSAAAGELVDVHWSASRRLSLGSPRETV